jgi:cell division protein FtsQ
VKRPEGFDRAQAPEQPKKPEQPKQVAPRPAAKPPAPRPERAPSAPKSPKSPKSERAPRRERVPTPEKSAPPSRADHGAAARDLRKAEAARRRYERSEVRRFTRRSRRRRITLVVVGIVFVLTGALITAAVYSPALSLKHITISGTSRVDQKAVLHAVDGQLGTPLALVDFTAIHAALAKFPLIRSYVTESVPPDTLVIRISERTPIGVIQSAAGFTVVDAAGVELQQSQTRPPGLPIVTSDAALTKSAAFAASVQVLIALPPALLATVDTITAHTTDDVTFTLTTGQTVTWGSADQSAFKAEVLANLIKANGSPAATYNVAAPNQAVVGSK